MIPENTIRASNGAEIYESRIHEIADQYIAQTLTEEERESARIDSTVFTGMLHKIYVQLFKPTRANTDIYNENQYQNVQKNSILDYDDIQLLDYLFDVYCDLCGKYRMCPSLLGYCSMSGISKDSVNDWINGRTHKSSAHSQTAKRWKTVCETGLEQRAVMQNSIGSIFALKAAHGWKENDFVNADQMIASEPRQTPEQIAERHKNAKRPELPQLDE